MERARAWRSASEVSSIHIELMGKVCFFKSSTLSWAEVLRESERAIAARVRFFIGYGFRI
jgi:predicted lipoprotein